MNTLTPKDVLEKIASFLELSIAELSEKVGYDRPQAFYDVINGKTKKISSTMANSIIAVYPEFNLNWLLTGNGDFLKQSIETNAKEITDLNFMQVPFVPIYAQGGYPKGYGDMEYIESLPTIPVIVDKNYRGKYRVFEVSGDSMDDSSRNALYDGDKILCREVKRELWSCKLHIKKYLFVVVHKIDGITVKQITEHDVETGDILCHPLNPIFEDFSLNLNDVAELYNVIKIVDRNTRI